jgi:hypothetical protein
LLSIERGVKTDDLEDEEDEEEGEVLVDDEDEDEVEGRVSLNATPPPLLAGVDPLERRELRPLPPRGDTTCSVGGGVSSNLMRGASAAAAAAFSLSLRKLMIRDSSLWP